MKSTPIHACSKNCFYNFIYWYYFSPIYLHALLGIGNFMEDGWSTCAPTAKEVVCDFQKLEKHCCNAWLMCVWSFTYAFPSFVNMVLIPLSFLSLVEGPHDLACIGPTEVSLASVVVTNMHSCFEIYMLLDIFQ
jgi:hypothetical protein